MNLRSHTAKSVVQGLARVATVLAISPLFLRAVDLAPERISNTIIAFTPTGLPIPPFPFLYAENGQIYRISSNTPESPLSFFRRYTWTKTGPNTATLVSIFSSGQAQSLIDIFTFSPTLGWYGTYREGSVTGLVRIAPFALTSEPPLRNTSARVALVPGGAATMGFVVAGATPRRVLVRAVGPALASFGVANPAAAPALSVLLGRVELASNGGWGGAPEVAAVFAKVGAFALPAGSRDCALVLTLAAGNYTAQVRADAGG